MTFLSRLLLQLLFLITALWFGVPAHADEEDLANSRVTAFTYPTTMTAGQVYNVSVTMVNTGNWNSETWTTTAGFALIPNREIWGIKRVPVPYPIARNQSVTFNFKVTAPSTPGTYATEWFMAQNDDYVFGDEVNLNVNVIPPPPPFNYASFVSQSVSTNMIAGQSYPVSVTMKNTGLSTWTAGARYRLGAQSPENNLRWGLNRVELPGAVPPGNSVRFDFNVTAPSSGGNYDFQWRMLQDDVSWFGDFTPDLQVTNPPLQPGPAPTLSVLPALTSLIVGQDYSVSINSANASSVAYNCATPGGLNRSGTVPVNGMFSFGAVQASWASIASACTWSASGSGGSVSATTSMTTVSASDPPTISVTEQTQQLVLGADYSVNIATTGATSVTYNCPNADGLKGSGSAPVNGKFSFGLTQASWVLRSGLCFWTVNGPNGSARTTTIITTTAQPAPPVATVTLPVNDFKVYPVWPATTATVVRIVGSATPDYGWWIESFDLYDNGVFVKNFAGINPRGGTFDQMVTLSAGAHTLVLYAIDGSKQKSLPVIIPGTVIQPTLQVLPISLSATAGQTFRFNWISAKLDSLNMACVNSASNVQENYSVPSPLEYGSLTIPAHPEWTSAPTVCTWTGRNNGVPSIVASVSLTTSAQSAPVATLSSPTNLTTIVLSVPNGLPSIPVSAFATPSSGRSISRIELFDGEALLLSKTGATINESVQLGYGLHILRVKATDDAQVTGDLSSGATVSVGAGVNGAISTGKSVPTSVAPGAPFNATVTMKNTASASWLPGMAYALVAAPTGGPAWTSTNRADLTARVDNGGQVTFSINAIAPTTAGSYHFRWQMAQGDATFGTISDDVVITVGGAVSTLPTLTASNNNVRVAQGGTATIALHGASGVDVKVPVRLELYDSWDAVTGTFLRAPVATAVPGQPYGSPISLDFTASLGTGSYRYDLLNVWSTGDQISAKPVYVNVTDSSLLGKISGVFTGADMIPRLIGWVCQDTSSAPLTYSLYINAPPEQGGSAVANGVANIASEPDNLAVQSACHSPGAAHHFSIDLNAAAATYSSIPAGTPLYVRAATAAGNGAPSSIVLPCENNNCTMPGSLRIALSSPTNAKPYKAGGTMSMQATVAGTGTAVDGVDFSFDGGTWLVGGPDDGAYRFILQHSGLISDPAIHTVQARVRQGSVTVYTDITSFTVVPYTPPTLTASSPANGASFAANTNVTLSVKPVDALAEIKSVKFLVNDVVVGSAVKSGDAWTLVWRPAVSGSAVIKAIPFDDSNSALVTWTLGTITIIGSSNSSDTPLPVVVSIPQLGSPDAGSLPGNLSVGDNGASNYSFPLAMPPGTAGMVPSLSLNYSSTNTTGSAGLGWSLGGLSNIDRCGRTVATDGVADSVRFTAYEGVSGVFGPYSDQLVDRLCLDGQRLVLVNGDSNNSAAYWSSAAEYRTEIESFTRVTTVMVGGHRSFKVETKDKQISYYGDTSDSFVKAQFVGLDGVTVDTIDNAVVARMAPEQLAHRWRLSRRIDRSGNYISYLYGALAAPSASSAPRVTSVGESKPTSIRWGGNCPLGSGSMVGDAFACNGGTPHYAAVDFAYEVRPDERTAYIAGARADERYRLATITTRTDTASNGSGGLLGVKYNLAYELSASSKRSLLSSIELCDGAKCLPKTEFTWGQAAGDAVKGFIDLGVARAGPNLGKLLADNSPQYGQPKAILQMIVTADFNGDGKADILEKYSAPGTFNQQTLYTSNSDGTGWTESKPFANVSGYPTVMEVGDFDGDGLIDVLVADLSGNEIATAANSWRICPGSHRRGVDFVCDVAVSFPANAFNSLTEPTDARMVKDLNADGKDDISFSAGDTNPNDPSAGHKFMCLSTGGAFDCVDVTGTSEQLLGLRGDPRQAHNSVGSQYVDVDGDGRVDKVVLGQCAWQPRPNAIRPPYYEWYCGSIGSGDNVGGIQVLGETERGAYKIFGNWFLFPDRRTAVMLPPATGTLSWDTNADGYSDMIFGSAVIDVQQHLSATVGNICYSKGNGFADCRPLPVSGGSMDHLVLTVADFDGDGIADVLRPGHDTWGVDDITSYQLCYVAPDAVGHRCDAWSGPVFKSMARRDMNPVDADGFVDKSRSWFLGDFNGDGKPDIATYAGGNVWKLSSAADQAPAGVAIDRLMTVKNGLGNIDKVEYAAVNDVMVYTPSAVAADGTAWQKAGKQAYPGRQLVKALHRGNGQGRTLDTSYTYAGYAVDPTGRGNLGFARVDVTDLKTHIVSTNWRSQTYPSIGMTVAARTVTASGAVLTESTTTYTRIDVAHAGGATTTYAYPSEVATTRQDLDKSDLGKTVTKNTGLDAWGNVGNTLTVSTTVAAPARQFAIQTFRVFDNAEASWRLGELLRVTEKRTTDAGAIDHNTTYTYDAAGLLATETRQDNDANLRLTSTYDRSNNAFGLIGKLTLGWRHPFNFTEQTRVVATTTYEPNGRFPTSVTNALGHIERNEFDHRFGTPTKVTTANGLVATWEMNLIGQRKETATDGTETVTNVKACSTGACPPDAATVTIRQFKRGDVQVAVPTLVYSDSAGHPLRSVTWGFDGQQIATDVRYDERGRVHETDQPRFDANADSVGTGTQPPDSVLGARTEYDDLNRATTTASYDEQGVMGFNRTTYSGFTTVSTNPLNRSKTDIRDVWGRLAKTIDAAGKVTLFEHDAYNNLTKTTDPLLNEIRVVYDALGRRTDLFDPDLGHIAYSVDPLGQVYKQASPLQAAAGQSTTMDYDDLGRMVKRVDVSLTAGWTYDKLATAGDCASTKSCGKLVESSTTLTSGAIDFKQSHTYNALGQPSSVTTMLDKPYTSSFVYDAWNRLSSEKHQRSDGLVKEFARRYNAYGALYRIERNGLVLWRATLVDAASRLTQSELGNGLTVKRDYNALTGRLYHGIVANGQNDIRLQEGYTYDALGNVLTRDQSWPAGVALAQGHFNEAFQYDEMNRLKRAEVLGAGAVAEDFTYNEIGNILTKAGTGTGMYDYAPSGVGSVGPHAVRAIPGIGAFGYDANGNLLNGAGRVLTWNAFDMPITITKGSESSTFKYGPDHQRTSQVKTGGRTIFYAGALEIEMVTGTDTIIQSKAYWPMGLGLDIDTRVETTGGMATTLNWTHVDRIGSVVAISNEAGALIEAMNYDSWGKRRSADALTKPDSVDGKTDNKGFTSHEMLDQLDLVHMNGRVYDPFLARFMSADPIIQDPEHSQSYNRYTYVWNNPTNWTDPTGFVASMSDSIAIQNCAERVGCQTDGRTITATYGYNDSGEWVSSGSKDRSGTPVPAASTSAKPTISPASCSEGSSASTCSTQNGETWMRGPGVDGDGNPVADTWIQSWSAKPNGLVRGRQLGMTTSDRAVVDMMLIAANGIPGERVVIWGYRGIKAGYGAYRGARAIRAAERVEALAAKEAKLPDKIFSSKAPKQATPGTKKLEGQYLNDKGRIEPWEAHYDEYGRQIGRTDYNAGNATQGIPETHYHTYEYGPGMNGMETGSHIPGEFVP